MNKRGQFYLIAAIFVVLIIFGTSGVATYTIVKSKPKTITDLSKDLNRETYKIVEYGILNNQVLKDVEKNFAERDISSYILKKSEDINLIFIYGGKNNINSILIKKDKTGEINLANSGIQTSGKFSGFKEIKRNNDFIEVDILEKKYEFKIKDNEMFYFLIVSQKDGEIFVERNEETKRNKRE